MKVYIVRHGQPVPRGAIEDPFFPVGDPPLTELGREQARLVGERLKSMGFNGDILASPYRRAMETADVIADVLGLKVKVYPVIREMMMRPTETAKDFPGMTIEEIKRTFKNVTEDSELEYPWWTLHHEETADVIDRIREGISQLELKKDTLFVCHGASSYALRVVYEIPMLVKSYNLNCSLSAMDLDDPEWPTLAYDLAHLPDYARTSNTQTYEDVLAAEREKEVRESK